VATDVYVFGYRIRLTNTGNEPAQLISRHWIIADANNQEQEVRGMGVVGEQPGWSLARLSSTAVPRI
jgi:ApaG protein